MTIEFTEEGSIGQIGEKIGGPFSSEGMIGRQFTTGFHSNEKLNFKEGSIGGTIERNAEKVQTSMESKEKR